MSPFEGRDRQLEPAAGARTLAWLALCLAAVAALPGDAALASAPAPGRFLVASEGLADPNFARTVVLLIDYDEYGAMGLIVNRPSDLLLRDLLPEMAAVAELPDTVLLGGPVQRQLLFVLSAAAEPPEAGETVLEGVQFSAHPDALESLVADTAEFRVFAGYAGWGPAQLDREIALGGWLVLPADARSVFDKDPGTLWRRLVDRARARWAALPGRPLSAAP